jgi:hypothetical protein
MENTELIEIDRLRRMAESLDCFIEEDFQQLAGATAGTIEAWRKRGTGPSYARLGNRYFYPRKSVARHIEAITHERVSVARAAL